MIRGTTPTFIMTIEGFDLTTETSVYVTFEQGKYEITKTGTDLRLTSSGEDTIVTLTLSQEETLAFDVGRADLQVRFIKSDGKAYATEKKPLNVKDVLYEEVISYA